MEPVVAPVNISIVGTGGDVGGGDAPTPDKTLAVTPGSGPNLIVNVVPPAIAIAVRAASAFLVAYLAQVTLGQSPRAAAMGSLAIAGTETIKNLITVFGRLEGKYPLLTGSI